MPKGNPGVPRKRIPVEQRFWRQVERRGFDECWPWTGPTDKDGYGIFGINSGELGWPGPDSRPAVGRLRNVKAHRAAFFLIQGHWPEPHGLHGCDSPPCCNAENPEHIHEGTPARNTAEMYERGRQPRWYGNQKLTDAQRAEMKARYVAGGVTQAALAIEYDVSQGLVNKYVRL